MLSWIRAYEQHSWSLFYDRYIYCMHTTHTHTHTQGLITSNILNVKRCLSFSTALGQLYSQISVSTLFLYYQNQTETLPVSFVIIGPVLPLLSPLPPPHRRSFTQASNTHLYDLDLLHSCVITAYCLIWQLLLKPCFPCSSLWGSFDQWICPVTDQMALPLLLPLCPHRQAQLATLLRTHLPQTFTPLQPLWPALWGATEPQFYSCFRDLTYPHEFGQDWLPVV